jgi:hypothetical protein
MWIILGIRGVPSAAWCPKRHCDQKRVFAVLLPERHFIAHFVLLSMVPPAKWRRPLVTRATPSKIVFAYIKILRSNMRCFRGRVVAADAARQRADVIQVLVVPFAGLSLA